MSMIHEVGIIVRDVAKGLAEVMTKKNDWPSEYLHLHYCRKCQHYHKAGEAKDGFPTTPRERKPREYVGMHYCEKCGRYHKAY